MLDRDRQILVTVARFGQASPANIREIHFHELASLTPMRRTLSRMVQNKLLRRVERRMVGGSGAGSGQYVYALGSVGWRLMQREGRYSPSRVVNYHTLAIIDAYTEIKRLENEGRLQIDAYEAEPDSWRNIKGADLRPDLYVKVSEQFRARSISLWVEVDLGTERPRQIKEKLAGYWHAYQHADDSDLTVYPSVVFLAPDDARERELRHIINEGKNEEAKKLFITSTIGDFTSLIFS